MMDTTPYSSSFDSFNNLDKTLQSIYTGATENIAAAFSEITFIAAETISFTHAVDDTIPFFPVNLQSTPLKGKGISLLWLATKLSDRVQTVLDILLSHNRVMLAAIDETYAKSHPGAFIEAVRLKMASIEAELYRLYKTFYVKHDCGLEVEHSDVCSDFIEAADVIGVTLVEVRTEIACRWMVFSDGNRARMVTVEFPYPLTRRIEDTGSEGNGENEADSEEWEDVDDEGDAPIMEEENGEYE